MVFLLEESQTTTTLDDEEAECRSNETETSYEIKTDFWGCLQQVILLASTQLFPVLQAITMTQYEYDLSASPQLCCYYCYSHHDHHL